MLARCDGLWSREEVIDPQNSPGTQFLGRLKIPPHFFSCELVGFGLVVFGVVSRNWVRDSSNSSCS